MIEDYKTADLESFATFLEQIVNQTETETD